MLAPFAFGGCSRRLASTRRPRVDHTDARDNQRENQAVITDCHLTQDQHGDQPDRVGLEQAGCHVGAVATLSRSCGLFFGTALLDLADQVHVLGRDAIATCMNMPSFGRAEAEALAHHAESWSCMR
jgi:hypothetical protein